MQGRGIPNRIPGLAAFRGVAITVRSSSGQDAGLSIRQRGFDSPTDHYQESGIRSQESGVSKDRPVAQLAERAVYTGQAGGSSPSRSTERGTGVSGSMPGSYPGGEGSSPSVPTERTRDVEPIRTPSVILRLPDKGSRRTSTQAAPPSHAEKNVRSGVGLFAL